MRKIKLAYVVTNCKKTGPIQQTLNLLRYLDRGAFGPFLVTLWPEEPDNTLLEEYRALGVPIFSAGLSRVQSILQGRRAVGRILRQLGPDIVHAVGMPPYRMTLGWRQGVRLTTLRNDCPADYPDQYGRWIGPALARLDLRLIQRQAARGEPFVVCSESLRQIYRTRCGLDFPCICNGVELGVWPEAGPDRTALRARLGLPEEKVLFVYGGGFIQRKNQQEAIEGFLKMEGRAGAALVLLGDGPDLEPLRRTFGEAKGVLFPGRVTNVSDYLRASDIYLTTSRSEGLPNGVLEAMACGLPVLASDIPQHREALAPDPGCGWLYPLGRPDQLAAAMDRVLRADQAEMGRRAGQVARTCFSAQRMSREYQALYRKLIPKNPSERSRE